HAGGGPAHRGYFWARARTIRIPARHEQSAERGRANGTGAWTESPARRTCSQRSRDVSSVTGRRWLTDQERGPAARRGSRLQTGATSDNGPLAAISQVRTAGSSSGVL